MYQQRYLIGGLVGGLFAPLAVLGFGLPIAAGAFGAVCLFAAIVLLISPGRRFVQDGVSTSQQAFVREMTEEARAATRRLRKATAEVTKTDVKTRLIHLGDVAERVIADLEAKPQSIGSVRRLLNYYLPSAVKLAEGYAAIERKFRPSPERVEAIEGMLVQLDDVFTDYADRMVAGEVLGVDVELELLRNELKYRG